MAAVAEIPPVLREAADLPTVRAFSDPEFNLLVACCVRRSAERIRTILSGPLDWKRMLALVDHHRVVPQVYGELSAFSHLIPAQHLNALRLRYQNNARKALWFTAELVRILNRLESTGIKALPYKGPVLAEALYGEVTERQFGDLDILILPADVMKAKSALLDLGYKPGIEPGPRNAKDYVETGYEYSFNATSGSNLLELQWRIAPRFYSIEFDVAGFFSRADEIIVGGHAVRTLRAEDLLLVLCVHAAKHVWVQLSWLCDIAQLIESRQFDWNAIQGEARRLGIERIVSLNLFLAHKLLGSALPPAMQMVIFPPPNCHSERSEESAVVRNLENAGPSRQTRAFQDDPSIVLADEILRIIECSAHCDTESLPYFRLMMHLRERWQDRARLFWRLAFTPSVSEWSAMQLPRPLQPLYRLVRLLRLARRLASAGLGSRKDSLHSWPREVDLGGPT
jgi:hypothetical protein